MLLQVRTELAMKAAGGRFLTKSEPRPLLLSLLASVVCDASLPAPSTSPWFIMCHPIEQPMEGQRMGWDFMRSPRCSVSPSATSPAHKVLQCLHHQIRHVLQGWMLILERLECKIIFQELEGHLLKQILSIWEEPKHQEGC